jgi:hypothetical protein
MSTAEIIIISIVISVCLSCALACLGFIVRDRDIAKLKDELGETRARLDELQQFTFKLYDEFVEHMRRYH